MIPGTGGVGESVESQGQTFTVAGYCVRRKVDAKDAGEADRNPASGDPDTLAGMPSVALGKTQGEVSAVFTQGNPVELSTASPRDQSCVCEVTGSSSPSPVTVPAPSAPSLPVPAPSSPSFSVQLPPLDSPFDKNGTQLPDSADAHADYERLSYDEFDGLCQRRGNAWQHSKAV